MQGTHPLTFRVSKLLSPPEGPRAVVEQLGKERGILPSNGGLFSPPRQVTPPLEVIDVRGDLPHRGGQPSGELEQAVLRPDPYAAITLVRCFVSQPTASVGSAKRTDAVTCSAVSPPIWSECPVDDPHPRERPLMPLLRREALCCIPDSVGRDSKGGSWV
jgi:hypothetical protein